MFKSMLVRHSDAFKANPGDIPLDLWHGPTIEEFKVFKLSKFRRAEQLRIVRMYKKVMVVADPLVRVFNAYNDSSGEPPFIFSALPYALLAAFQSTMATKHHSWYSSLSAKVILSFH